MTILTLYLAARGLPFSGSSLKIKISPPEGGSDDVELGETDVVDGADADHAKSFPFEYTEGGADDARRISIDVRNENGAWQCSRSFVVGDIISSNKCSVEAKKLSSGGVLIAHLTSATVTGSLKLQLSGKDLKNMDGMGLLRKSDPFFALMVLNDETGNWDAKYRSATVKNELDPEWEECSVDLVELCGGKLDQRLRVVVFDEDDKKKMNLINMRPEQNEVMGYAETSVNQLLGGGTLTMLLRGKDHGHVVINTAELVDYSDPKENVSKVMEAAGKIESTKIAAAEAEAALERAKESLEAKKTALEEAQAAAEEAELTLQSAQEAAFSAKEACDVVAGLFDELDLGE